MHGSNRLGGNSLSDLLVFGRRAGIGAAEFAAGRTGPVTVDEGEVETAIDGAVAPFERDGGENPYEIHHELQTTMQELVGIIRTGPELEEAMGRIEALEERAEQGLDRRRAPLQPGLEPHHRPAGHADRLAAARPRERSTARRAAAGTPATTIRRPIPRWGRSTSSSGSPRPDTARAGRRRHAVGPIDHGPARTDPGDARRAPCTARGGRLMALADEITDTTDEEIADEDAGEETAGEAAAAPDGEVVMRLWRGDASGGEFTEYTLPAQEGEVVLDVIHRVQATQAPDLACRWNCKAGKCGSCSAEINGRPGVDVHDPDGRSSTRRP